MLQRSSMVEMGHSDGCERVRLSKASFAQSSGLFLAALLRWPLSGFTCPKGKNPRLACCNGSLQETSSQLLTVDVAAPQPSLVSRCFSVLYLDIKQLSNRSASTFGAVFGCCRSSSSFFSSNELPTDQQSLLTRRPPSSVSVAVQRAEDESPGAMSTPASSQHPAGHGNKCDSKNRFETRERAGFSQQAASLSDQSSR